MSQIKQRCKRMGGKKSFRALKASEQGFSLLTRVRLIRLPSKRGSYPRRGWPVRACQSSLRLRRKGCWRGGAETRGALGGILLLQARRSLHAVAPSLGKIVLTSAPRRSDNWHPPHPYPVKLLLAQHIPCTLQPDLLPPQQHQNPRRAAYHEAASSSTDYLEYRLEAASSNRLNFPIPEGCAPQHQIPQTEAAHDRGSKAVSR